MLRKKQAARYLEHSSVNTVLFRDRFPGLSLSPGSQRGNTSLIQVNRVRYPQAPKPEGKANLVTCEWCF